MRRVTRAEAELFLLSFTALFFQIVLIRWIPATVPLIAFFTNLVLLASFLGLGLGYLLTGWMRLHVLFFPLLLNLLLACAGISQWSIGNPTGAGSERIAGMMLGSAPFFLDP